MGGGTCYNGGWLPPGMLIPGGVASPAPAPVPAPAPGTCATPDPFVALEHLVGACVDGGWVPVEGIRGTGTVRRDDDGEWVIEGDDGQMYCALEFEPFTTLLQSDGLHVSFSGVPQESQSGMTVIQILTIGAL